MKIAVLGGSFDPPHLGHKIVAEQLIAHDLVDEVLLMPCFHHPFSKELSSAHHRLAMTRLLEADHIRVSDYEVQKQGVSYTIDTLTHLSQLHPENKYILVIGSDQWATFHKWKHAAEILKTYGLIVFPREGVHLPASIPQEVHLLNNPEIVQSSISSTAIRQAIKAGESFQDWVTPAVWQYIIDHNLYGTER